MENPKYIGPPNNKGLEFVNANGTDLQDLITGAMNGTKVTSIFCVNEQAAINQNAELWWYDGANDYFISTLVIPQGAGTNGSPSSSFMSDDNIPSLEVDNNGNLVFNLGEGEKLKVKMQVAIAGGESVYITAMGADY